MASPIRSDKNHHIKIPRGLCGFFRFLWGRCNHDFVLISTQPIKPPEGVLVAIMQEGTNVLIRCCHCGTHITNTLSGNWTLETLLSSAPEFDELEELYRK